MTFLVVILTLSVANGEEPPHFVRSATELHTIESTLHAKHPPRNPRRHPRNPRLHSRTGPLRERARLRSRHPRRPPPRRLRPHKTLPLPHRGVERRTRRLRTVFL